MKIENKTFIGERALFNVSDLDIANTTFKDGESPLKESSNLLLSLVTFDWKYPLWYGNNIKGSNLTLTNNARAGIWYTKDLEIKDSLIEAPKTFRRCQRLSLENINLTNASETLWHCEDITLDNILVKGDYFALNCHNIKANKLEIQGNYPFDGCKHLEIRNSKLLSKDALWNCEDVIVYDSYVSGEYIGWNSKNITFINCTMESLQGFCYIENLKMINCKLINTTLAFEYCSLDVEVNSSIDSIINPKSGQIRAHSIGNLILDETKIDPSKTKIILKDK